MQNPRSRVDFIMRSVDSSIWETWHRPRGASMLYIMMAAGGGGGGGGHSGASGTGRGGGGGGGQGNITHVMVPLVVLPDPLYIQLGRGGYGGAAATDGQAGGYTRIHTAPIETDGYRLYVCGPGSSGKKGTASVGGAGGSSGAALDVDSGIICLTIGYVCYPNVWGGGKAGGWNAVGTNITAYYFPNQGGPGGGAASAADVSYAGGGWTGGADAPYHPASLPGGVAPGGDGLCGNYSFEEGRIHIYTPATGGAGHATGTGGRGGTAALSCGGGGGGGGVTGGAGGDGGHGFVMLISW